MSVVERRIFAAEVIDNSYAVHAAIGRAFAQVESSNESSWAPLNTSVYQPWGE